MARPPEQSSAPRSRRSEPAGYRRIREAAAEVFGVLGFQKATIDAIASAAQVSKPLVYKHFDSKERLYEEVVGHVVKEWNDELTAAVSGAETTPDALRVMHRVSLDFALSRPLLRGLLAKDGRLLLASYSDVVERATDTWRQQIAAILEGGVAAGEIRADLPVSQMADVISELHLAYADRAVAHGPAAVADRELRDTTIECLLHGIAAPRAEAP